MTGNTKTEKKQLDYSEKMQCMQDNFVLRCGYTFSKILKIKFETRSYNCCLCHNDI